MPVKAKIAYRPSGAISARIILTIFLAISPSIGAAVVTGFCFPEPNVRAPDSALYERINQPEYAALLGEGGARKDLVRTIVTHESGGNALAVSPSGCAGIGAVCHKWFQACCKMDPGEDGRYQKCDNEINSGYHCDLQTDPRFDPRFSLRYIDGYLAEIMSLTGASNPVLMAMAYNGGPGFLAKLLKITGPDVEPEEALKQIDLLKMGYPNSSAQYRVLKMIEIYDYVQWIETLLPYWQSASQSIAGDQVDAGRKEPAPLSHLQVTCFKAQKDGWSIDRVPTLADASICPHPQPLQVYRLEFGDYVSGQAIWCKS